MSMQDELKNVLDIIRNEKTLDIKTTPNVKVNQHSSPKEIKNWLVAKDFSKRLLKFFCESNFSFLASKYVFTFRVIEQLSGFNGAKLFKMSRDDLIAAFGQQEGKRLDGQITLCRNQADYQTARSSELRDVLKRHRALSEKHKTVLDENTSFA